MDKLASAGFEMVFTSLENGIDDYVNGYLANNEYF